MNMTENNEIISPCINICKTDPISGYCYGCGRSTEDKSNWKEPETTNVWKQENLLTLRDRLTGWQQLAFDKSYENKKNTGNSLLRQKLIDSKN